MYHQGISLLKESDFFEVGVWRLVAWGGRKGEKRLRRRGIFSVWLRKEKIENIWKTQGWHGWD